MATVKKIEWGGWPDCIQIEGGGTEAVCTTAVGPRMISLTRNGGKNHLSVDEANLGKTGGGKWLRYGGVRLWHAPEEYPRSYLPDNAPVNYELLNNGVILTQNTEQETGITKQMTVTIGADGAVSILNRLTNSGACDVRLSVWSLAQLAPGGLLFSPLPDIETGLTASGCVAVWPYGKMNDQRIYFGERFITLTADGQTEKPFKYGAQVKQGYAGYFNHGQLVVSGFSFEAGEYPNYASNFESYVEKDFIELESLSPLVVLKPGESARHLVTYRVFDRVHKPARDGEDAIAAALKSCGIN